MPSGYKWTDFCNVMPSAKYKTEACTGCYGIYISIHMYIALSV